MWGRHFGESIIAGVGGSQMIVMNAPSPATTEVSVLASPLKSSSVRKTAVDRFANFPSLFDVAYSRDYSSERRKSTVTRD
jgi:hypothetical protein